MHSVRKLSRTVQSSQLSHSYSTFVEFIVIHFALVYMALVFLSSALQMFLVAREMLSTPSVRGPQQTVPATS